MPFQNGAAERPNDRKNAFKIAQSPKLLVLKKIGPAGPRTLRHTTPNTFFEAFQRATGGSLRKNAGIIHGGGSGPAHIYLKTNSKDFAGLEGPKKMLIAFVTPLLSLHFFENELVTRRSCLHALVTRPKWDAPGYRVQVSRLFGQSAHLEGGKTFFGFFWFFFWFFRKKKWLPKKKCQNHVFTLTYTNVFKKKLYFFGKKFIKKKTFLIGKSGV